MFGGNGVYTGEESSAGPSQLGLGARGVFGGFSRSWLSDEPTSSIPTSGEHLGASRGLEVTAGDAFSTLTSEAWRFDKRMRRTIWFT